MLRLFHGQRSGTAKASAPRAASRKRTTQAADYSSLYQTEADSLTGLLRSCDRLQWNQQVLNELSPDDLADTRLESVA